MQKIAVKDSLYKKLRKLAKEKHLSVSKIIENSFENQDPLKFFLQNFDEKKAKILEILFKVLPKFDVQELRAIIQSYEEIYPEVFPQEKA